MFKKVFAVLLALCIIGVATWGTNSSNVVKSDVSDATICDMEPEKVSF